MVILTCQSFSVWHSAIHKSFAFGIWHLRMCIRTRQRNKILKSENNDHKKFYSNDWTHLLCVGHGCVDWRIEFQKNCIESWYHSINCNRSWLCSFKCEIHNHKTITSIFVYCTIQTWADWYKFSSIPTYIVYYTICLFFDSYPIPFCFLIVKKFNVLSIYMMLLLIFFLAKIPFINTIINFVSTKKLKYFSALLLYEFLLF